MDYTKCVKDIAENLKTPTIRQRRSSESIISQRDIVSAAKKVILAIGKKLDSYGVSTEVILNEINYLQVTLSSPPKKISVKNKNRIHDTSSELPQAGPLDVNTNMETSISYEDIIQTMPANPSDVTMEPLPNVNLGDTFTSSFINDVQNNEAIIFDFPDLNDSAATIDSNIDLNREIDDIPENDLDVKMCSVNAITITPDDDIPISDKEIPQSAPEIKTHFMNDNVNLSSISVTSNDDFPDSYLNIVGSVEKDNVLSAITITSDNIPNSGSDNDIPDSKLNIKTNSKKDNDPSSMYNDNVPNGDLNNESSIKTVNILSNITITSNNMSNSISSQKLTNLRNAFDNHLVYPEPIRRSSNTNRQKTAAKTPSAISSDEWRKHYEQKENEKTKKKLVTIKKRNERENSKQKKRKQILKTKKNQNKITKNDENSKIPCAKCSEELNSDTDDDDDKKKYRMRPM